MLRLERAALEAIHSQAREEYPLECCGILSARAGSDLSRAHPCRSIQNDLHAADPARYPRDARHAYYIHPGDQCRAVAATERGGGRITGFYHSHVDCDAHFSDLDRERTMLWDEPAYPEAVYLVVSVSAEGVRGHRAFQWRPAEGAHGEVDVEVVE